MKGFNEIEGEVIAETRHVEEFREHQRDEHAKGYDDAAAGQGLNPGCRERGAPGGLRERHTSAPQSSIKSWR